MKVYQGLMWAAGRMLDTPALAAESRLNEHKQNHAQTCFSLLSVKKRKKTNPLMIVRVYI